MRSVLHCGDALDVLRELPDASCGACVTSPPYWMKRDYGCDGQIGMEPHPDGFVARLLPVFQEVRRVLAADAPLWINCGDSYAASGKGGGGKAGRNRRNWSAIKSRTGWRSPPPGFKRKDLTLVPFRLAEALRRDGWYLRSVVVWARPAAVEPMRIDRPAVSHEYLFLFASGESYRCADPGEPWWGHTVWTISPENGGEHHATMPVELARRCIAATPDDGTPVLDPFAGAGTTGVAAARLGRPFVGIDLSAEYVAMAERRIRDDAPLWNEVEVRSASASP